MPLRDHFRPPISTRSSWEGLHGGWPMAIVQRLSPLLPIEYTAEPRVHLGPYFEIDVCAFEDSEPKRTEHFPPVAKTGRTSATLTPPAPTWTVDVDIAEEYAYEVLIYDQSRERQLVAAVEIVSPGNKDRSESRSAFVSKCAALLQQGVCVSLVDLVTTRHFNLYTDLLSRFDRTDPAFLSDPPSIYAVTCRCRKQERGASLESWAYALTVGQPLPSLPVWLTDELNVPLELELSYEETCRALRIP